MQGGLGWLGLREIATFGRGHLSDFTSRMNMKYEIRYVRLAHK